MPHITNTTFNPNTPPSFAEDIAEELSEDESPDLLSASAVEAGNRLAMAAAGERDMRAVVGTTQVGAAQRDLRLSESRAEAARHRADLDAARGGPTITTALKGDVGAAVSDCLGLEDLARQASAIEHRISAEVGELEAAKTQAAEDALLDELLSDGWDASGAKRAVPAILAPFMRAVEVDRPKGGPGGFAVDVRARLARQHAYRNTNRVLENLGGIEKLLSSRTQRLLDQAGTAADTLKAAGLSVDATAEDIVEHDDPAVSAAWRAWREAVSRWTEVQSTRRWLAVALSSGFDPKRPLELLNDTDAEQLSWRHQFVGADLWVACEGSHMALVWWLAHGRPAPAGVAALLDGGVS
ncbi:hypothetical protein AYK61_04695 [Rhodococcus sp. SBT000017]|uniref:hypothetical protein n=1 Tax=Rhodococcus sp. SBT000017 TaxID=1803385 RepID=UPI000EF8A154|nr:hypothetical protein [Rhodococcus sp. SBT000017]RMB75974.1 hypothetical protein AYK61_04695 [Rhodococcus sp. SBT000017]